MTVTREQVQSWKGRIDVARDMLRDVAGEIAAEAVRANEETFDPLASSSSDLIASASEADSGFDWLTRFVEPYAVDATRGAA